MSTPKRLCVVSMVLVLVMMFIVVCAQPPPDPDPTPTAPPPSPTVAPIPTPTSASRPLQDIVSSPPTTPRPPRNIVRRYPTKVPTKTSQVRMARIFFMNSFEDVMGFNCNVLQSGSTMICNSPSHLMDVLIALNGPADDLSSATIMIWHPETNADQAILHLAMFMSTAIPLWDNSAEWIADNVRAAKNGRHPTTSQDGAKIEMDWDEEALYLEVRK